MLGEFGGMTGDMKRKPARNFRKFILQVPAEHDGRAPGMRTSVKYAVN